VVLMLAKTAFLCTDQILRYLFVCRVAK